MTSGNRSQNRRITGRSAKNFDRFSPHYGLLYFMRSNGAGLLKAGPRRTTDDSSWEDSDLTQSGMIFSNQSGLRITKHISTVRSGGRFVAKRSKRTVGFAFSAGPKRIKYITPITQSEFFWGRTSRNYTPCATRATNSPSSTAKKKQASRRLTDGLAWLITSPENSQRKSLLQKFDTTHPRFKQSLCRTRLSATVEIYQGVAMCCVVHVSESLSDPLTRGSKLVVNTWFSRFSQSLLRFLFQGLSCQNVRSALAACGQGLCRAVRKDKYTITLPRRNKGWSGYQQPSVKTATSSRRRCAEMRVVCRSSSTAFTDSLWSKRRQRSDGYNPAYSEIKGHAGEGSRSDSYTGDSTPILFRTESVRLPSCFPV